ncbi:MAG: hypothetical protein QOG90_448 [Actinomycetota bacterium]
MSDPPEDAYSRVTNPERFRVLHTFADAVFDAFLASYEIESVDHDVEITYVEAVRPTERSVRIVPAGGGAPVVIGWTSFPGLLAQFGNAPSSAYPACGCDACNDDPFGSYEELHRDLWDVVNGQFQEWVKGGHRFYGTDSRWAGDGVPAADAFTTWRSDWQPWRRLRHW